MELAKRKGNKYAGKAQRASMQALAEMGYQEVGYKTGSHFVMMHPTYGRLEVPKGTPPHIVVGQASRKMKQHNNKATQVVEYLLQMHHTGPSEARVVSGSLNQWIAEAQQALGGEIARTRQNTLLESVRKHPQVTVKSKATAVRGGHIMPGTYELRGMYYIAPDEQDQVPDTMLAPESKRAVGRGVQLDLVEAQRLLDSGLSPNAVGEKLGMKSSVYYHLKHGKLTLPVEYDAKGRVGNRGARFDLEQAQALLDAGVSQRVVAESVGVTPEAISRNLREGKLHRSVGQPILVHTDALVEEAPKPDWPENFDQRNAQMRGLTEYLNVKDMLDNTRAKIDLIEAELVEMNGLFNQQAYHLDEIQQIQAKINRSIETIRSL